MSQQTCSEEICRKEWKRQVILKKQERAAHKEKKEAVKSLSTLRKEAQAAFNRFIRLRDEFLPCISCGRLHKGQYHAGHYMATSVRPGLRFDEANVHKQCAPCNTHLHGNLLNYRKNLIVKIGLAEVERLEGPAEYKKFSREWLIQIKQEYSRLANMIERTERREE